MARTAKKHKKKDPRRISTNPRRSLFLLNRPLNELPKNQLPTVGDILRHIQYLRSPKSQRFGPLKPLVACLGKSGTTELVCTAMKECPGRKDRCMTSAITDVWGEAGFGKCILSPQTIRY